MAMATDIDICQTLVHEMVHLWQFEFGKPSRAGYHNKEWAKKMQEVGLMPSNTGKEGGKKTGQNMSDYPIEGGVFVKAFKKMPDKIILPFKSAEKIAGISFVGGTEQGSEGDDADKPKPTKPKKNKTKYTCSCGTNIWGKPELNVICGDCEAPFKAVN
jgi:predicted SprT family Zn-dependent metalloprotease